MFQFLAIGNPGSPGALVTRVAPFLVGILASGQGVAFAVHLSMGVLPFAPILELPVKQGTAQGCHCVQVRMTFPTYQYPQWQQLGPGVSFLAGNVEICSSYSRLMVKLTIK